MGSSSASSPLIDIGANLHHRSFDVDRAEVIARAVALHIDMVITGTSVTQSQAALNLAEKHALHATVGIHPHDARHADAAQLSELRRLSLHPACVAVGECGLDYDRDFSPRPQQQAAFEAQLALAADLGKPVFLHERAAHHDFHDILRRWRPRLPAVVVHCFTGSAEELDAYLALDAHIGITGWICDERRGLHLQTLIPRIPLSRLMLETDAPFLTPRTLRPLLRRNEPAFLPLVLATVATSLGLPAEEVAAATTATARAFFKI